MLLLTRRELFSSAHRLFNPEWTDEKNLEAFGNCSNPNWHGHNYSLWVTVKGDVGANTGFSVNLKTLSLIIKQNIIEKLDHRNINIEVDFMKGKLASTENLAIGIWETLQPHVQELGIELYRVKLQETENNYVEYFGNNPNHGNSEPE
jgi:6-pyruvoyltetrahydropterin/6-carboxytetrahydropterin synthase